MRRAEHRLTGRPPRPRSPPPSNAAKAGVKVGDILRLTSVVLQARLCARDPRELLLPRDPCQA